MKNKNNLISISPPASPPCTVSSSPEPSVSKEVLDTSVALSKSLPESTVSEKVYPNSETYKDQILSDNKNKSGIYLWKNLINGKQYIGSAIDLTNRLSFYFSCKAMKNYLKNSQSYIYNALLNHGHSKFSLTILEYCSPEKCLEREDYYLCSLSHEYNILQKAGSRLGHEHSEGTKTIMSGIKKRREKSNVWKKSYRGN